MSKNPNYKDTERELVKVISETSKIDLTIAIYTKKTFPNSRKHSTQRLHKSKASFRRHARAMILKTTTTLCKDLMTLVQAMVHKDK